MCICVGVRYMCVYVDRVQKVVLNSPALKLQANVEYMMWVLQAKLGSYGRASALNPEAISPASRLIS